MPVFFISSSHLSDGHITIDGSLFNHLSKSLRFREGEALIVCDETRQRHHLIIQKIAKNRLEGEILKSEQGPPPSQTKIILAQAMLKGDHMTWAIQKAIELGVSTIVPLFTERVIVRPKPERFHILHDRYTRIALDAAQQSERWEIPEIGQPTPFKIFLEEFHQAQIKTMLVEREASPGLNSLRIDKDFIGTVILAIGPEGGWTQEEKEEAKGLGFIPISLGAPILRGETAPLAALSIIQFRLGNLG